MFEIASDCSLGIFSNENGSTEIWNNLLCSGSVYRDHLCVLLDGDFFASDDSARDYGSLIFDFGRRILPESQEYPRPAAAAFDFNFSVTFYEVEKHVARLQASGELDHTAVFQLQLFGDIDDELLRKATTERQGSPVFRLDLCYLDKVRVPFLSMVCVSLRSLIPCVGARFAASDENCRASTAA